MEKGLTGCWPLLGKSDEPLVREIQKELDLASGVVPRKKSPAVIEGIGSLSRQKSARNGVLIQRFVRKVAENIAKNREETDPE